MSVDLYLELWHAVDRLKVNPAMRTWLENQGVPKRGFILPPGPLGLSQIQPFTSGAYEPGETGPECIIVPAYEPTGYPGELIDMIAFVPKEPNIFFSRTGYAAFLGYEVIADSYCASSPLKMVETPLEYLRASGKVCCPLDNDAIWGHLHDFPAPLVCSNRRQAELVEHILNPAPTPGPKVLVEVSRDHHA